jgi:hypothetical protein
MGTYPWGPHGPQSGPNEVTPNPTPAYVPPPASSDWGAPAPTYSPSPSYGGGGYSGGGVATYSGPRRKSYIFAVMWTAILGPFGMFYYTMKGALIMLLFLFGVPIALTALGHAPGFYEAGDPISIIGNEAVMNRMWSTVLPFCVIWGVIAVRRHNKKAKAAKKALADLPSAS